LIFYSSVNSSAVLTALNHSIASNYITRLLMHVSIR